MSIPVDLADLVRTLGDFDAGYLLSTAGERVKAVTVEPRPTHGALLVRGPGAGSLRNVAANPAVTLLFPPREPRGYTLLVDAHAAPVEGSEEDLLLTADHAVLHRPADHADHADAAHPAGSTSSCGQDCHPVTG